MVGEVFQRVSTYGDGIEPIEIECIGSVRIWQYFPISINSGRCVVILVHHLVERGCTYVLEDAAIVECPYVSDTTYRGKLVPVAVLLEFWLRDPAIVGVF